MAKISYGDICDAIAQTLSGASGLKAVESFSALKEAIPDCPVLRVYPEAAEGDVTAVNNDRASFRGGVRVQEVEIVCDVPCRQRSDLAEDSKATVEMADQLMDILEQQDTKPYFGLAGINGFRWRWERTVFMVGAGDGAVAHLGIRLRIFCRIF